MGLFSKTLDSFETLFFDQIQDLYDAEQRLTKALPNLAKAADNAALRTAFEDHLKETQRQVTRLEQIFWKMNRKAEAKTCEAMKGLIAEGDETIAADGEPELRDAALIAAAQRVEHYEIAGYGCARTFAEHLGRHDIAQLLQETLNEEAAADRKLTQIAEESINRLAESAAPH